MEACVTPMLLQQFIYYFCTTKLLSWTYTHIRLNFHVVVVSIFVAMELIKRTAWI